MSDLKPVPLQDCPNCRHVVSVSIAELLALDDKRICPGCGTEIPVNAEEILKTRLPVREQKRFTGKKR